MAWFEELSVNHSGDYRQPELANLGRQLEHLVFSADRRSDLDSVVVLVQVVVAAQGNI